MFMYFNLQVPFYSNSKRRGFHQVQNICGAPACTVVELGQEHLVCRVHDDGVMLDPAVLRDALVFCRFSVKGNDDLLFPCAHLLSTPVGLACADGNIRLRALEQSLLLLDLPVDICHVIENDDVVAAQKEPAFDDPRVLPTGGPFCELRFVHARLPVDDDKCVP